MVDSVITLYESTETEFLTNGLGSLPDAISCFVTEERNGSYELEMEYPVTGKRYSELINRRIIYTKPNPYSDPQPFRIYNISKPINGIVTVNAAHISYDLSGIPVSPFTAKSAAAALATIKSSSAIENPFTFWTDNGSTAEMSTTVPLSARSLLGGVEGSVLDTYGGEYEFDKFAVKLRNNRGLNRGVSIRYGKNLTDLRQDENCDSVYTGVYPYWYSETDGLVELSEKVLAAEGTYNFTRICPLDLSQYFDEPPTEELLRELAKDIMAVTEIGVPTVSLEVSFVQLAQSEEYKNIAILEKVYLCDTVNVEFPELGVSATAKCIKTVFNVLTDKYDKLELGSARSNLATTIANQSKSVDAAISNVKSALEQAIDKATQKITLEGLGGYVMMRSSTGGSKADELLIMDTEDVNTATKVWRWNKAGLGYSKTGYNGPYELAMLNDGSINASMITTGELDAYLIKTGAICSADGKVLIDLLKGSINLNGQVTANNNFVINSDGTIEANGGTIGGIRIYDNYLRWGNNVNASNWLSMCTPHNIKINDKYGDVYVGQGGIATSGLNLQAAPEATNPGIVYSTQLYWGTLQFKMGASICGGIQAGDEAELGSNETNGLGLTLCGPDRSPTVHIGSTYAEMWNNFFVDGDTEMFGFLNVHGTKSRIVTTNDFGERALYCYETTSPVFGDIGEGTVGEDGIAYVDLDPVFEQTISTDQYQVFLQRYGDGDIFVSERKPNYFIVKGTPGMKFGWEIKSKQSDFSQLRLSERLETKPENYDYGKDFIDETSIDYGSEGATYYTTLKEEMLS